MSFTGQALVFESDAVPEDTLIISKLRGVERLSAPFRFDLELVSQAPDLDLERLLYAEARVGLRQRIPGAGGATRLRRFGGVLASVQQLDQGKMWTSYRATLVPRLWTLGETSRSRVFLGCSIPGLATEVLEEGGLAPDLDFRLAEGLRALVNAPPDAPRCPKREYVVQYEETDLDFLHRWLEHEGIYYFFEDDGTGREVLVLADSTGSYRPFDPRSTLSYRPQGGSSVQGEQADGAQAIEEVVRTFACEHARLPREVVLDDYNWRAPLVPLRVAEPVRGKSAPILHEYNDHYRTPAQGKELGRVRKEELTCRERTFRGESDCRGLRPGRTFDLDGHYRRDWNGSYLLTEVTHEAEQLIALDRRMVTGARYENAFSAIPADLTFRPARTVAWPAIKGVMHARVDAEGDGPYAELAEHGRYKDTLPFDQGGREKKPGRASRWIRMAQPYAGVRSGMHFPLLKGTEVLLTHIDGDPDRPIIASAVPDADTPSPTTGGNSPQNQILTTSGNLLQIDDQAGREGFRIANAQRTVLQIWRGVDEA